MNIDFSECKGTTAIQNKLRSELTAKFLDFLKAEYGNENVFQIAVNEVGAVVGEAKDEDGWSYDVCAVVRTIAKPIFYGKGEKRETKPFDIRKAAEDYQMEVEIKKNKKKV